MSSKSGLHSETKNPAVLIDLSKAAIEILTKIHPKKRYENWPISCQIFTLKKKCDENWMAAAKGNVPSILDIKSDFR